MPQSTNRIFDDKMLSILYNVGLFNGFSKEETLALCLKMNPHLKGFDRDDVVLAEGDDASRIGIICKGKLSVSKVSGDGSEHILALHETGEMMGLDGAFSHPQTSPLTFTALEKSEILFLNIDIVNSNIINIQTANRLLRNLNVMFADKCVRLIYKTEVLSKRSLRMRIMTYLRIQQRKQGKNTFYLKMDREQFAQYLCVNRSALSRELSDMQRSGVIKFGPDGAVTLKDPDF